MKTLELAKKAVTRIAEVAITQEHFDSWDSRKQKQWLKDHPNSKFGKKEAPKAGRPIKQADLKKSSQKEPEIHSNVKLKPFTLKEVDKEKLKKAIKKADEAYRKRLTEDLNASVAYFTKQLKTPLDPRYKKIVEHTLKNLTKKLDKVKQPFKPGTEAYKSIVDPVIAKMRQAHNKAELNRVRKLLPLSTQKQLNSLDAKVKALDSQLAKLRSSLRLNAKKGIAGNEVLRNEAEDKIDMIKAQIERIEEKIRDVFDKATKAYKPK